MNKLRNAKVHQEMLDREASLLRAKVEASLADGISWGMSEDAIEEATEVLSVKNLLFVVFKGASKIREKERLFCNIISILNL